MTSKTFEILDRMTFIPVLATRLDPITAKDRYLISRAGFGTSPDYQAQYVMLTKLATNETSSDPNSWGGITMEAAHEFIRRNFDSLQSGSVVDSEYLRGETIAPKLSEAVTIH